jgi:hypothetical protein
MSISPESPWRGAAAFFRQPVNRSDELAAQSLIEAIYNYNVRYSSSIKTYWIIKTWIHVEAIMYTKNVEFENSLNYK